MDLQTLSLPFPKDAVHWRAQTLTSDGSKALALAYLDARDVMDRLDEVCGPENWQSEITETAKGRVICRIGIRVGDDWVWKSDGAGDTAVEGEKGGISDSLKRAAVQWGIGRYLYRLEAVWAPCESYEKNGKLHWKAWKGSPWQAVRGNVPAPSYSHDKAKADADAIGDAVSNSTTKDELRACWDGCADKRQRLKEHHPGLYEMLVASMQAKAAALMGDPAMQAPGGTP